MDRTLRDYLNHADECHEQLEKYFAGLTSKQVEDKILEMQANIKTIQAVAYQIANISNIASRALSKRSKYVHKFIDPLPNENDCGVLRSMYPIESKELVDGIQIPVKTIDSAKDIPIAHIYYVNDIKQYAINIEGIVIKGNLGNIVNYQIENSVRCEYGIECKSFKKNIKCKYYHDPEDYIKCNMQVPDNTKNFTVGSWIYSKTKTPRTYFARHIGSKDNLIHDLNTIKRVQYREEIANREGQLIHDLLIYLVLNSKGLLERYIPWF